MRGGCANTISGVRSPVRFAAIAANTAAFPMRTVGAGVLDEADPEEGVLVAGGTPVGAAAPVTTAEVLNPNSSKEIVAVLPG